MLRMMFPSTRLIVAPRSTICVASVTMKAFMRSFTTKKPLKNPIRAPVAIITTMVSRGFSPRWEENCPVPMSHAANMAVKPTVDSSDRSKWPVSSTRVSPRTSIPTGAECRRTFRKFGTEKNFGIRRPKTTIPARRRIQIMLSNTMSRARTSVLIVAAPSPLSALLIRFPSPRSIGRAPAGALSECT